MSVCVCVKICKITLKNPEHAVLQMFCLTSCGVYDDVCPIDALNKVIQHRVGCAQFMLLCLDHMALPKQ
jgi:hypothetical protein